MQGANKTINTKVGLDLPMSEQVRQRQVTLNEGKTLVNTKGVYCSKFGNETHFPSFAATRNRTEGSDIGQKLHDDAHRTLSLIVFQFLQCKACHIYCRICSK